MSGYDFYVFILCLIVAGLMIGLASFMVTRIYKLTVRSIKHGLDDEQIKKEYLRTQGKSKKNKGLDFILSLFLCIILCVVFAFSLYVNLSDESFSDTVPTIRVVKSDSMSKKHERNVYLAQNDLNDQFFTFDIILTYKIPDEEDLELYDIVVYESDGTFIVHRIVGIEEPTEDNHPGERWFVCQGDANGVSDRFPVKYEYMRGIYRGERLPFVGSFVLFMQSPAGWLCVFLVVAAFFIIPFVDKKIWNAILQRLREIGFIDQDGSIIELATATSGETSLINAPPVEKSVTAVEVQTVVTKDLDDNDDTEEDIFEELDDDLDEEDNDDEVTVDGVRVKRKSKTFFEMLSLTTQMMQNRYTVISELIERIDGLRLRDSKKYRPYCLGNKTLIKLSVRGRILYVNLALDPKEYEDSIYLCSDESADKKYATTPTCVSLVTDLRTDHAKELLYELIKVYGLEMKKEITEIADTDAFSHLKGKRDDRTFFEKLAVAPDYTKERFESVDEAIKSQSVLKLGAGKKVRAYKYKNCSAVKMYLRGKTLNLYLALDPKEFIDSKYKYTDASDTKKYSATPMRIKLTSNRQVKHAIELIRLLVEKLEKGGKS